MILVIGSSGQVGRAIQKELKARGVPVTGTYLEKPKDDALRVSLTDEKTIADAFEKAKPSTVILSAAMTNVDLCESMSKECFNVNVEGTKRVVKLCEKHGSKLVFFSSDYVFDGKNGPYVEEDSPNPLSVYGSSKFEGEKITLSKEDSIVVRTTWIFSAFDVK
ncbi:MAG: SDR family oxidoreductase, partial [Candidatus Micrarchaeia archaeon]